MIGDKDNSIKGLYVSVFLLILYRHEEIYTLNEKYKQ
jgi:hypothetical protein